MFSSALVTKFVCLQDYPKTTYSITQLIFTKFGGKVVYTDHGRTAVSAEVCALLSAIQDDNGIPTALQTALKLQDMVRSQHKAY